jgi:tetratricopeptide (TPR) repeat protein
MLCRRLATSTLVAVAVLWTSLAHGAGEPAGRDREQVLNTLFESLAGAPSKDAADLVTASIWRVWEDSGSPTTNLLMERALETMKAEDYETALQILDEVVWLDPGFAEGWNRRATVHFKLDQFGASVSDLQRVLAIEPRHFGAMVGLGEILKETGRERAALGVFRKALLLNPHLEGAAKAVKELAVEVEGRDI